MIDENGLYQFEDIAFCNTREFTRAAQHYMKHGCYTFAPEGTREFNEYWDIEEERRKNGMVMPGKLVNGKLQEIHITGEHYGFLNYARILRTVDNEDVQLKELVKTVRHARKVGKKDVTFPDFWDGHYHYMKAKEYARNNGLHVCVGKARRKGFSYIEAWDSADTINLTPYVTVILGAFDLKYLTKGDQMMTMAKNYLDFLETDTDWTRHYITESKEEIELGYKLPGTQIKRGYRGKLLALSFGPANPDAAIGKDAVKIKMEEAGKFPNLKESLEVTMSTMEAGDLITGQMVIFGTGGTKDANWEDFEDIYYNPLQYDCMAFDNIWDEGATGNGVGFFFPHTQNLEPYIDEHGNSDRESAKESYEKKKAIKKETAKDNNEYVSWVGQRAECPREAFSRGGGNLFPSAELVDQLHRIEHNNDIKYLARKGDLVRTPSGIKLVQNDRHPEVTNFPPKKEDDMTGVFVEWQPPYRKNGVIPRGLYRIWNDPYAQDKDKEKISLRDSLGATYVYEVTNNFTPTRGDILVAAYIGRPPSMDDYNDNLLKIVEYYNGECMFENDRGDVKPYFQKAKKLHLLADEPEITWKKELASKTGRGKGMHMTDKRIAHGAIYLRDWLKDIRGYDEAGNAKLNLHYIYDAALVKELLKWNLKGNFDRVSALLIGMYDMKETLLNDIREPEQEAPDSFWNTELFAN